MRSLAVPAVTALAALLAPPASAGEPHTYTYDTHVNYCPAGLQPVVFGGVVSCGRPTTRMSWQEVKRHPVPRTRQYRRGYCPSGQKGC
jgi:hypothetical protein